MLPPYETRGKKWLPPYETEGNKILPPFGGKEIVSYEGKKSLPHCEALS
jgi:hypothetical protein